MKRMPDGVDEQSFYENRARAHARLDRTVPRHTEERRREEGRDRLPDGERRRRRCYIANLGCIEIHPLHARCTTWRRIPTTCSSTSTRSRRTRTRTCSRRAAHQGVLDLGLTGYPKTSGATGLQNSTSDPARHLHARHRARPRRRGGRGRSSRPTPTARRWRGRSTTAREDLHRPHRTAGREHRGGLLDAARAARVALDAADMGRGDGRRLRAARLPDRHGVGTASREALGDLFASVREGR